MKSRASRHSPIEVVVTVANLSRVAASLTLVVCGCTAEITGGPGPSASLANNGVGGGAGSSGASGSGNGGSGGIKPQNCAETLPVSAPLRRLTRFEYNNTVRDLAQVTDAPAAGFPPEEVGSGFGTDAKVQSVSALLADKYITTARKIAARLTTPERISELAACASAPEAANESACVNTLLAAFVPRAYRRPLEPGEAEGLLGLFQTVRSGGATFPSSVAAVLEAVLQTPEFLYRPELGVPVDGRPDVRRPTDHEMATRLSYLFLGSMPDPALFDAAAAGRLSTPDEVKAQAAKLLEQPQARDVVRFFFDNLLPIQGLGALVRSDGIYATFNGQIGNLMRQETQTLLEREVFGGGTWPGVLAARHTYVNQELATFYGIAGVTGSGFQKVALDGIQRGGLLTQGGIVAGPVHSNEANPVVRGNFVLSKLLCMNVGDPPASLGPIVPPSPALGGTARDRFTAHSNDGRCVGCHRMMDPLGFALEHFNPVGLWQEQENDQPIDVTVDSPQLGKFTGAVEMGDRLAASEDAQRCFALHWANFAYGRPTAEQETCSLQRVQNQFKSAGYNIKQLLLELTQTDTFLYLPAVRP